MRAFTCQTCGSELFFENSVCITCGSPVAFDRASRRMVRVVDRPVCANLDRCGCNWLAEPDSPAGLCFNCTLTRTRPADGDVDGLRQYAVAEAAKRRLVVELDELGLPVVPSDGYLGLAFDLLSSSDRPVTTGYDNGVITLDLAESDDAHRESLRASMAEPYRTVLGHFRHEIGHYYAEVLLLTTPRRSTFVDVFGEPSKPYVNALHHHYDAGAPPDWSDRFISAYASMHPLEDFAEVFAHLLHICEALRTANAFGLITDEAATRQPFVDRVTGTWLPLAKGLNQINRSMGKADLYPFVIAQPVLAKLDFVARVVAEATARG